MTRQRQLTFLNSWVKDYQKDAENILESVQKALKKEDYILIWLNPILACLFFLSKKYLLKKT